MGMVIKGGVNAGGPLCTHCHRVLNWEYLEKFGPTCPECMAALGEAVPDPEPIPEEPEPPVFAPVEYRRKGRKVEEAEG